MLAYYDSDGLSNARTEAVNGLMQRIGHGFRNFDGLRTSPVLVSAAPDRGGCGRCAEGVPPREDVGRDEAAWQIEFHGRTDDGTPWPSTERTQASLGGSGEGSRKS